MNTLRKITRSSTDPEALSLTIRGILVGLIPLIIALTGLTEKELMPIVDGVIEIINITAALVSAVWVTYGLIRKAIERRWTAAE